MAYHYYATAQKPTCVNFCEAGSFTSSKHINLLLARNNVIEIFLVCPEGLRLLKEVCIYGKISAMKLFRSSKKTKDHLFVLTAKFDTMILECNLEDDDKMHIFTKAYGNISERMGEISELSPITIIDPDSNLIAIKIYNGLLKVIELEENNELRAVNIRIEETNVQDIKFIYGFAKPTIALLHSDINGMHLKIHELSMNLKELSTCKWKQENIETDASIIIPIPKSLGGTIVVGQESILYHDGNTFKAIAPSIIKNSAITCYARVDATGFRHVLCDMAGNLFMLLLETEKDTNDSVVVKDIKVEFLGEVSIPECITYLDNGVFFIGSRVGESQVVKLNAQKNPETGSYLTIMDSFLNIAPIVDMIVVDFEGHGQTKLVTCSGSGKEGALNIITNGISIQEHATIELSGVTKIWTLRINPTSDFDNVIILSFIGQTKVLGLKGDEVEEIEIPGFIYDQQTLYSANIDKFTLLQVIPTSIRLISLQSKGGVIFDWRPPTGKNISVVALSNYQLACALGSTLYYFEILNNEIVAKNFKIMKDEISCLDISPVANDSEAKFITLGLWNDISARVILLPDLKEVHVEYLKGEIIPRSILYVFVDEQHYILCGMGNGTLVYFRFDPNHGELSERKRVTLGSRPIELHKFNFVGTSTIFACSDLPTVIYSSNNKLIFSNVNIKRINCMCSLNSDAFPGCLILVSDNVIMIGTMNEIQKLHIRTVPLQEGPRRIAYQAASQSFGVVSCRADYQTSLGWTPPGKEECASLRAHNKSVANSSQTIIPAPEFTADLDLYHFLLLDQQTFEVNHACQMLPAEQCLSLISAKLGKDLVDYFVVGTAFIAPEDSEPKRGRIIIFQVQQGTLVQVAEEHLKGAVYALCGFNGKLLASIGCTVYLFEWNDKQELRSECNHNNNIIALYLRSHGDFVLIGDLMRSVSVIQYIPVSGSFDEVCRDYNPHWMTAIEIIDDDTYLGAENSFNIFSCRRDNTSTEEDERERIQEVGMIYLGDLVNVFRKGSLTAQHLSDSAELANASYLLGTVSGAIGVVTIIDKANYDWLLELQSRLVNMIKPVGKIHHGHWRAFRTSQNSGPAKGFIDGDLIECFLDLSRPDMMKTIEGILYTNSNGQSENIPVDEVIKKIENYSRLH